VLQQKTKREHRVKREHREKREHRVKREKKSVEMKFREKNKQLILGGPASFF
jgi:hypothetical protein